MRATTRAIVVASTVFSLLSPLAAQEAAAAGTAQVAGPDARIVRDGYGVPHIYAATAGGLFFGQGFATAEDRLWQADLVRRTATGHLAALLGPGDGDNNIGSDEFFRLYSGGANGLAHTVATLDAGTRTAVTAFVHGMNAEIAKATREGSLPVEYAGVGATPQQWTAQDIVASGMLMAWQVGASGADELSNAQSLQDLVSRLGPADGQAAFADAHWLDDPSSPTTIPQAAELAASPAAHPLAARPTTVTPQLGPGASMLAAQRLASAVKQARTLGLGGPGHSNAIALSGRLTSSGHPLLLGGPQVGLSVPQGFMELSLNGAGFDATGVTLPGVPGVLIGVGFDHAWTITSGGDDNEDLYAETLDGASHPGAYRFNGQWRSYDCRPEVVDVAGASAVTFPACESVHGPVLGNDGATAIALRDAPRALIGQTISAFLSMDRARTLDQFVTSAQRIGTGINVTYADTQHIAYAHVGPVPVRPASDNRFLPHPGDGSDEWLGLLPTSQLPLSIDPAQGWLANWNNKPRPSWANSSDGFWQWGPVQRVQAITRQLNRLAPHSATRATLEQINRLVGQTAETPPGDESVVVAPALINALLAKVRTSDDPRLAPVVSQLWRWNLQRVDQNHDGAYDDPSVSVFTAWYTTFVDQVVVPVLGPAFAVGGYDDNTTANIVSRLLSGSSAALPLSYGYVHGGSLRSAVTGSLVSALGTLTGVFGTGDVRAWLTPDVMTTWSQLGAGSVAQTPFMNRGTYNQIVSLDSAGLVGENVVAPGQSGDLRSPHFSDQLALYASWRYKAMRITQADVLAHATSVECVHDRVQPL
ncbi:penicillin acylase family protein [Acidothermaceae bacterium B102]|nr:penicillin acylase family protein [Acidothermaceae bacterium B102]